MRMRFANVLARLGLVAALAGAVVAAPVSDAIAQGKGQKDQKGAPKKGEVIDLDDEDWRPR